MLLGVHWTKLQLQGQGSQISNGRQWSGAYRGLIHSLEAGNYLVFCRSHILEDLNINEQLFSDGGI